jgi:cytosine/adenosine deaminase-related metal-dependent hydrolase
MATDSAVPIGSRLTADGFVNAHTHLYSGLAPFGMPAPEPPPENFVQVLERLWWRLDRALDERALRASARWYVADALAHGTVALVDHHESPDCIEGSLDVLADACQELGMPAVLCYGATERNGGRGEARRGLAECRRFIERNTRPLVRGVVGLHASFTVSDDTVREAGALCRSLGTVLHIHVAEDGADVADAGRRGWPGPLERLLLLDALPPGSILAHGVHLSAGQVRDAERLGCWLVQNPRSNRGNRVGYPAALHQSTRVALGTDGYPSDPGAEREALLDEARAHGDDLAAAERRPGTGHALLAELFGEAPPAARTGPVDIETIRAEAATEARRLWSRMAAL